MVLAKNSGPATGRSQRPRATPLRFRQGGESGAACGHGQTPETLPEAPNGSSARESGASSRSAAPATVEGQEGQGSRSALSVLSEVAFSQGSGGTSSGGGAPGAGRCRRQARSPDNTRRSGDEGNGDDSSEEEKEEEEEEEEDDANADDEEPPRVSDEMIDELLRNSDAEGEGDEGGGKKSKGKAPRRAGPAEQTAAAAAPIAKSTGAKPSSKVYKLQVSAARAKDNRKGYREMSVLLLQRLCVHRGIRRMSTEKNSGVLALKLEGQDLTLKRTTPYYGDFDNIVEGKYHYSI